MQNNFFFELIPLLAFFITYYISKNLFLATAICMVASVGILLFAKLRWHKISKNTWLNTILILFFGSLTLLLHNKTFVMLKPTVLYWIIGIGLLLGQIWGKNPLEIALAKEIKLEKKVWLKLNTVWGLFFIALGGLNLYVVFNFSEYFWVKFKVFGCLSLTFILMLLSILYIYFHSKKHERH